jgi:hypothetical protein
LLISPDELESAEATCSLAASSRARNPDETAAVMHISLGLVELVQRHAWANARTFLERVRDPGRGVFVNVAGIQDGRRP